MHQEHFFTVFTSQSWTFKESNVKLLKKQKYHWSLIVILKNKYENSKSN